MPIHRRSNNPHLFYPHTAKELGISAAVVELAIEQIGYRGPEEDPRYVDLDEVLRFCWYLPDDDVYEAYKALKNNNVVEEVEK